MTTPSTRSGNESYPHGTDRESCFWNIVGKSKTRMMINSEKDRKKEEEEEEDRAG